MGASLSVGVGVQQGTQPPPLVRNPTYQPVQPVQPGAFPVNSLMNEESDDIESHLSTTTTINEDPIVGDAYLATNQGDEEVTSMAEGEVPIALEVESTVCSAETDRGGLPPSIRPMQAFNIEGPQGEGDDDIAQGNLTVCCRNIFTCLKNLINS